MTEVKGKNEELQSELITHQNKLKNAKQVKTETSKRFCI